MNGEVALSVRQQTCRKEQIPNVGRSCKEQSGGRGGMSQLWSKPKSGFYSISVKVIRGTHRAMRYLVKQEEGNRNYT